MSHNAQPGPGYQGNWIIETVPVATRTSLLAHIEYVRFPVGHVLYRPHEAPRHVHFLTSGLVSLVTCLATGHAVNVGLIGSEGIVESFHMLGASEVATEAVVQVEATALRAPFADIQREFQWAEPLRQLVLQQIQEQGMVAAQLVACNAIHGVDARLARWLLMIEDRLGSSHLHVTQAFLADMVATHRPTVTAAVGRLQRSGAICSSRGNVEILDRSQLERTACECYPVIRGLSTRSRGPG